MSSAISFAPSGRHSTASTNDEDPRPSSTSVVATLRHSPRLLLRKSASALKEPPQSPDIFARGAGPSLRASTRLQTRNTSARLMNTRSKRSSRQLQPSQQEQQSEQRHAASNSNGQSSQYTNNMTSNLTATTSSTTQALSTATTSVVSPESLRQDTNDVVMENTIQTRSLRSLSASGVLTESTTATTICSYTLSSPSSRILAASGHQPTSISTEETNGSAANGSERRSRVATRSTSQTRESTRSRSSRTRTRARAMPLKTLKGPGVQMDEEEKSDEDDDDEDDAQNRYHLRSPAHHRRRSLLKRPSPELASNADISRLTLTPRLTRLGARHESGHDFDDDPEQDQELLAATAGGGGCRSRLLKNLEMEKNKVDHQDGRRSRSSTSSTSSNQENKPVSPTVYTSSGAHVAPKKTKKKSVGLHKVPSLPSSGRRLRGRTTKIAKMGIDKGLGNVEDEDDIEDDGEDEDEDEDEEEFESYPRSDQDEEMTDAQQIPCGLSLRQQPTEDISGWTTKEGFIASKPEASLTAAGGTMGFHAKRKVGDEDMEDPTASISLDEGQVVSTKLARIDETTDNDKNGYMKTFYNILKSPRDEDDEGILSSESEDADLESEDDDDDFEEIDVWEFIATLPPLGPLPVNFAFTMPERTSTTPPITLVLDIDETLVHCATRPLDSPDMIFPVEYNQETWEVYGRIRPGMHEFLEKMSTKFEVITFTASQECYAEALLKLIDPDKKFIKHRYYRDSCVPVFGNYVKDLRILNRDLSKVIIIDNSPQAFGYQISNGIPIESWYDDKSDRELAKVMEFLESLEGVEDVRPKIDEQYRLQERIQKALAMASQHQLSSMSALGGLGATLGSESASITATGDQQPESGSCSGANSLASLQSVVPDNVDMDTNMYDAEKLVSASDDDEEDDDGTERMTRGRRRRANANKGQHGGRTGTMTMKTRSNSLDLDKISL